MPSQSQASSMVPRGGRSATGASGAGAVGLRRRPARGSGEGGSSKSRQATMNYYTDDSPGLKLTPPVVIAMSLGFILFVTVLHVIGKIRGV